MFIFFYFSVDKLLVQRKGRLKKAGGKVKMV